MAETKKITDGLLADQTEQKNIAKRLLAHMRITAKWAILVIVTFAVAYDYLNDYVLCTILPRQLLVMFNNTDEGGDVNRTTVVDDAMLHEKVNRMVGIVFSMRVVGQVGTGLLCGFLVDRFSNKMCFVVGSLLSFNSILAFGLIENIWVMCVCRFIQGCGGFLTMASVFSLIPQISNDDIFKSRANIGVILALDVGIAFGGLIGGLLYQAVGWNMTFVLIACVGLVDLVLRLLIKLPLDAPIATKETTQLCDYRFILGDMYVMSACIIATLNVSGFAFLNITVPAWTIRKFNSQPWQLSLILGIGGALALITEMFYILLAYKLNSYHYLVVFVGVMINAAGLYFIGVYTSVWGVLATYGCAFVGGALYVAACQPLLGVIVETRQEGRRGMVYSIYHIATKIAILIGSVSGGFLVNWIGMEWSGVVVGTVCALTIPFALVLGKLPTQKSMRQMVKWGSS